MQRDLTALLEPVAESLGYELVWVQLAGEGRDLVVRVYIDGPDGIGLEDCERVSREVSALMDVEDPISGNYTLEVSSPGLDRPLVKPQHFDDAVGSEIKVRLGPHIDGRKRFRGRLEGRTGEAIDITVDGEAHRLALADIESARLVPEV